MRQALETDLAWLEKEIQDLNETIMVCTMEGVPCARQQERHANLLYTYNKDKERYQRWMTTNTTTKASSFSFTGP